MDEPQQRVDIYPHLRLILKVSRRLGFTHFTYNPSTNRFEHSTPLYVISRIVLCVGQVLSGYYAVFYTLIMMYTYLANVISPHSDKSYEAVLTASQLYCRYVMTFAIIRSYLRDGHLIIPTLNEMLRIFEILRARTNAAMFFEGRFQSLFVIKVVFALHHVLLDLASRGIMVLGGDFSSPIGIVLTELTFWTHMYANLVLTCFYLKMNEVLERRDAKAHIRRLIKLSFRIHRVKDTLNRFYTVLHARTYLGLFDDIFYMCMLFRKLLELRRHGQPHDPQAQFREIFIKVLMTFFSSFDMFLIGYVGELLVAAETRFRRKLWVLYASMGYPATRRLQVDMELMLVQNSVMDLSCRAFQLFVVDRRFTFNFFKDIIIANAIACLQLFVNEI